MLGTFRVQFTQRDTGHFQYFRWRTIGKRSVARSGRLALQVRPVKLANKAVMDLRTVRWVPVGVDDDSESNAR